MKIFLTATLIFMFNSYSNQGEFQQEITWQPYMAEHMHPGCPFNSTCSPQLGQKFLNYFEALKTAELKKFFLKNGIPVTGNRKKKISNKPTLDEAIWDSPCEYKQNKKALYDRVMIFSKNLNQKNIQYPYYFLKDSSGKIIKYSASDEDSVLGTFKENLVFNRLIEGVYYQYQVTKTGEIRIEDEIEYSKFGKTIQCSKELLASIENFFTQQELNLLKCRLIYGPMKELSYLFYLPRCE